MEHITTNGKPNHPLTAKNVHPVAIAAKAAISQRMKNLFPNYANLAIIASMVSPLNVTPVTNAPKVMVTKCLVIPVTTNWIQNSPSA